MAKPSYFSKIFASSPVAPLQKHIEIVVSCVEELVPYFTAVLKENWVEASKIQAKIASLENDADNVKNQLRLHLPTSLFMPVDRRDVLERLLARSHPARATPQRGGDLDADSDRLPLRTRPVHPAPALPDET